MLDNKTTGKKLSVANGDFLDIDQKKEFNKKLVLSLVHEGWNLASTAKKLGVARKSIYNWMNEDPDFERGVRAGSVEEIKIKAMVGLVENINQGDLAAQKYYLDRVKYFEKRQDIGEQNNLLTENEQGVFEVPSDIKRIADSLVDDYEEINIDPGKQEDILKYALSVKDADTANRLQEVRNRFHEEDQEEEVRPQG